ncbi:serine/threonine protein phosphatase 2A regulatory subunit B''beta-like isoform X1 [Gossypium australe]|uniref:Serine/threonine protein phosphatase 2A regulatory subunit B''beta-like isoform X1 n=1 Tax=Gossypium australe TaxID=47621 RepID=A0A5B6WGR7_9ROSI|nr:serine/threonine protein phosphatase 2A regulatory subunit B''beta-like isoform X1 [Gossypium australe]
MSINLKKLEYPKFDSSRCIKMYAAMSLTRYLLSIICLRNLVLGFEHFQRSTLYNRWRCWQHIDSVVLSGDGNVKSFLLVSSSLEYQKLY